jgi:nucleoside-diphosphate-sugar epimerase
VVDIVTGCAGFIGSHQTERLLKDGQDVVGIDNFHGYYDRELKQENIAEVRRTAERSDGSFRLVEGDIRNSEDLQELPEDARYVFHHAAIAGVRYSIDNPVKYTDINVLGTSKLLAHLENAAKFVFTSSSSVYGEVSEEELPVDEDRDLDPIAPYPMSKKQAEETVRLRSKLYGIDHAIVRPFTVYGPRQRPDEAFTKFIKMILDGEPVTIYGDGEQSRDFTHVEDIVSGCMKAAEKGDSTYNLGSNRRVTVNRMVQVLDQVMDEQVETKNTEQPEGDVSHTHADISKAERHLDYKPEKEFRRGVEECVKWVKSRREQNII